MSTTYNWTYASIGNTTRVKIVSGEDIRHLSELDQKLWTVLSCPVDGLEIAEDVLRMIDRDADGKIHVNDVIAASEWLCSQLTDPAELLQRSHSLPVSFLADEAMRSLTQDLLPDSSVLTVEDVAAAVEKITIEQDPMPAQPFTDDVMAAYAEKRSDYEAYFAALKLQKMGLATISEDMLVPGMSETDFVAMGETIAAYQVAKQTAEEKKAAALAQKNAKFEPLYKLLMLNEHFYTLLCNFVSFQDFYSADKTHKAIFQAGTLYIDQRACHLCIRVNDMSKHDLQAENSDMFLMYLDCVNKAGQTMKIAAAITNGDTGQIAVGKNAIFYDRKGQDWDATIVKIIDNPISIRQAFFAPYKKFIKWVQDLINKSAAEKDAKVFQDSTSQLQSKMETLKSAENGEQAASDKKSPFDIAKFAGIFAAIGMAIGYIGEFFVNLARGINSTPWWHLPLWFMGILLVISGPSMILARMKLRRRNLAPLLNANGWAVNAISLVSVIFGNSLTETASYPLLTLQDPFATEKKSLKLWQRIVYPLVFLLLLMGILYLANVFAPMDVCSPLFPATSVCPSVADSVQVVQ